MALGLIPKPGTVLAGGHTLPRVQTSFDKGRNQLTLTFKDLALGPNYFNGPQAWAPGEGAIVKSVELRQVQDDLQLIIGLDGSPVFASSTVYAEAGVLGGLLTYELEFRAGK